MPIKRDGAAEICEEEMKEQYFDKTENKSRDESQFSFINSQDENSTQVQQRQQQLGRSYKSIKSISSARRSQNAMFYSNVKLQFQSDIHTSKDFVGSPGEANSLASS